MREAEKHDDGAGAARTSSGSAGSAEAAGYPPMPVKTVTVIKVGMAVWAVALVVTLVVPALREGDRHWWPWTAVAGLVLGTLGYLYVRRGRGNAEGVT